MKKKYYIRLEISKHPMVGAQVNPNYLENWLLTLRADLTSHKKNTSYLRMSSIVYTILIS
jgi:hypothetical protein